MDNGRLTSSWWTLKIALGLVPLITGLHKFFNVLTNWTDYANPALFIHVPIAPEIFVRGVGILEMIVGIAILTRWTRLGAYLAALWLTAVAVNLATMGRYYDVAMRDLVLAVAAITLARMTETRRAESTSTASERATSLEGGILRLNL